MNSDSVLNTFDFSTLSQDDLKFDDKLSTPLFTNDDESKDNSFKEFMMTDPWKSPPKVDSFKEFMMSDPWKSPPKDDEERGQYLSGSTVVDSDWPELSEPLDEVDKVSVRVSNLVLNTPLKSEKRSSESEEEEVISRERYRPSNIRRNSLEVELNPESIKQKSFQGSASTLNSTGSSEGPIVISDSEEETDKTNVEFEDKKSKMTLADTQSMADGDLEESEIILRHQQIALADTESMLSSLAIDKANVEFEGKKSKMALADTQSMIDGDLEESEIIIRRQQIALADTESMLSNLALDKVQIDGEAHRIASADTELMSNDSMDLKSNSSLSETNPSYSWLAQDSFADKSHSLLPNESLTVAETSTESDLDVSTKPTVESVKSPNTDEIERRKSASPAASSQVVREYSETINISAKININIQISHVDESSEEDESVASADVSSPKSEDLSQSEKSPNKLPDSNFSKTENLTKWQSPQPAAKDEFSEQAKLLTKLYGEAWKTPDVVKTLRGRQVASEKRHILRRHPEEDAHTPKTGNGGCQKEQKLNETLDNTPLIPRRKPGEFLESTRLHPISAKSVKKPQQQNESTPMTFRKPKAQTERKPTRQETEMRTRTGRLVRHRWQNLIDPDTSSDEELTSDDSYLDETFASDGVSSESEDEKEDIKPKRKPKKGNKRNQSKKDNDNLVYLNLTKDEIEIEQDVSLSPPANHDEQFNDRLKTLLDSCKFEGKKKIESEAIKSKRKLFTPRFGSEDEDEPTEKENKREARNKASNEDKENVKISTLLPKKFEPINKQLEAVRTGQTNFEFKTPTPVRGRKGSNRQVQTPLSTKNDQGPADKYGFLKSLDVRVSKSLCHPEALIYRESYKTKKEELAQRLYKLYNERVFNNELNVPLVWSKKLLSTAGRCINRGNRLGKRTSEVELSEKVLTSADRLRCTLIHELCHAATWILSGDSGGHGAAWKAWARKSNFVFPELPTIDVCHNYEIEYKYTYQCTLCLAKSHAHSKSKKVENIRCAYCHGPIEVFLNKKDKNGEVTPTPVKEPKGFAKFVKDKYKEFKRSDLKHAEVMKLLSNAFAELDVEEKRKY